MGKNEEKWTQSEKETVTYFEQIIYAKNETIESLRRTIKIQDEIIRQKDERIKDAKKAILEKIEIAIDKVKFGLL